MRKIASFLIGFIFITQVCFGAWDASKPANNEKLKDTPAEIRANWDAIATGTDSALLITNAKCASNMALVDTKLDTISTAGKVSGTAITGLASLPSGAGAVPILNGGTGQTTNTAGLTALLPTQTGNSGKALVTNATVQSWGYPADLSIASQAQGDILYYSGSAWTRLGAGTNGYYLKTQGASANPTWSALGTASGYDVGTSANNVVQLDGSAKLPAVDGSQLTGISAGGYSGMEVFTSSGTWTKPTGITKVLVEAIGAGGGGTGGSGGGDGGNSSFAGTSVTVTGGGGKGGYDGSAGNGSGGTFNLSGTAGIVTTAGHPYGIYQVSYGSGGSGSGSYKGGGGGGYSKGVVAVSGNVNVVVGTGGSGAYGGGTGQDGLVIVEW